MHRICPSSPPWREWDIKGRDEEIDYAEKHNVPLKISRETNYSKDKNLWHLSHEGLDLEDPANEPQYEKPGFLEMGVSPLAAPDKATYVTIDFEKGVPVAVDGEKCKDVLSPGTHGSTFGGNPMAAAAANVVMDTLTPEFLAQVKEKGDYLKKAIEAMDSPLVTGVRGMGLMLGVGVTGITHTELHNKLMEKGLLALTAGKDTLRLLPPLVITKEEMDQGLAILKQVLDELKSENGE